MSLYTKIVRFFLRDLYAREESLRNEMQSVSGHLHQIDQELNLKIHQLEHQNQELLTKLEQSESAFRELLAQSNQGNHERSERSEKRIDCLEHYRSETEKRMQSDDETTLGISHRIELIESALQEHHIFPEGLHLFDKKTYSQAGEDAIIVYACAMLGIPFNQCRYLDLGANKPVEMSNTYFFYEQGARGVLLEANPLLIPELKKQRSEDIILNRAVSGTSGESVTFNILNLDGLSKIGDVSDILERNSSAKLEQSIGIETISYNEIIRKYFHEQAPVILNLDIEGLEMQILESIDWERYRPLFIILEMIPYSQKLSAGIKDTELLEYLQSRNYIEYAFTGINSIFIDKLQYEKFIS